MQAPQDEVRAWKPSVDGVAEVFHAFWKHHAYPAHTHDKWVLLVVDHGMIGYDLDRNHDHVALRTGVTLLPPHVPHDGHALSATGFRKRVLYLEEQQLAAPLIGRAVDAPYIDDLALRGQVSRLDLALTHGEDLEAESRLGLVIERLASHLNRRPEPGHPEAPSRAACLTRDLFDADPVEATGVTALASELGVSTAHLVRSFTRQFGIPPHRYLLGRRLDLARRLLLDGYPPAQAATMSGFYDQAHLNRHFRRLLGTTPGRYQRSTTTAPSR